MRDVLNYHRASDAPDTLDYAFMREVSDLLAGTLTRGSAE